MHKKTALITGGAGFIGSHLSEKLLKLGYQVIVMDNFITGNLDNIKPLLKDSNFRLIVHNVSQHIKIAGRVDFVLHCASLASPTQFTVFVSNTER